MKIFQLIAAVGAVGVIANIGVASAADLPVKAPPPIAPVPTWTGCYIGANGGWGFGKGHDNLAPAPTAASQAFWDPAFLAGAAPSHFNYDTSGGVAGIQGGCNNQIGSLVLGAEADIDWANIRGSDAFTTSFPPAFVPGAFSSSQNLKWLGTIRGRFGYAPSSQWLFVRHGRHSLRRGRLQSRLCVPGQQRLSGDFNDEFGGRLDDWSRNRVGLHQ